VTSCAETDVESSNHRLMLARVRAIAVASMIEAGGGCLSPAAAACPPPPPPGRPARRPETTAPSALTVAELALHAHCSPRYVESLARLLSHLGPPAAAAAAPPPPAGRPVALSPATASRQTQRFPQSRQIASQCAPAIRM
jgi:hypothetical protein